MGIFKSFGFDDYYYISTAALGANYDCNIAKYIGITLEEYQDILKSFNAFFRKDNEGYFDNESDCQKCCEYLNETYGVIIKLADISFED
jgi:hypothetical protein